MTRLPGDLPDALRDLRRYLPWRTVPRANGRLGKVPQARRGPVLGPCDPLRPANWGTLAEAWAEVAGGHADGVGLAVTPDLGCVALDLDDCVGAHGGLNPLAGQLLSLFPAAYAELSPSGRGVHLLVRGTLPPGPRRFAGTEVISRGFLTVTGRGIRPAIPGVENEQPALDRWYARQLPAAAPVREPRARPAVTPVPVSDCQVLERAFNARSGPTFRALWRNEPGAAPTASEGDVRLAMMLAYWLGDRAGVERLDALFRQSLRMRDKWDEPRGDATYGERTLRTALQLRRQAHPTPGPAAARPGQDRTPG